MPKDDNTIGVWPICSAVMAPVIAAVGLTLVCSLLGAAGLKLVALIWIAVLFEAGAGGVLLIFVSLSIVLIILCFEGSRLIQKASLLFIYSVGAGVAVYLLLFFGILNLDFLHLLTICVFLFYLSVTYLTFYVFAGQKVERYKERRGLIESDSID